MSPKTGRRLDPSTIEQYFLKAMAQYKDMYGHPAGKANHQAFFRALSENPGDNWFVQLRKEMESKDRDLKNSLGETIRDTISEPLTRELQLECCDKLSLMNTATSLADKTTVVLQRNLCNRASDMAITWENLRLDQYSPLGEARFIVSEWQKKVSDQKPVPLLPGNDNPNMCTILALGDLLIVGGGNLVCKKNTPTKHFVLAALVDRTRPSGAISVSGVRVPHPCTSQCIAFTHTFG